MISEYVLIVCFLSLCLMLFFSATGHNAIKNIVLLRNADKGEFFRKKNARLDMWYRLVLIFIGLLILFRTILLFYYPQELLRFKRVPTDFVHYLLIQMIFILFWSIVFYFMLIKNDIRLEERYTYLRKNFAVTVVFSLTDLIFSMALGWAAYTGFFKMGVVKSVPVLAQITTNYIPLLWMLVFLIFLVTVIFILFILRRSITILKQYWISLLLLLGVGLIFIVLSTLTNLGWRENTNSIISLFSLNYLYLGWMALILLSVGIFCNTLAVIIMSMLTKFTNQAKFRTYVITLIKLGYVSSVSFAVLVLIPDMILWFYA